MSKIDINKVLAVELFGTDIGDVTVRQYLKCLLKELWSEEESFSGKRPFGNSGWKFEVYLGLVREGIIKGEIDEDGYLVDCNNRAGDKIIVQCIDSLFS